MTPADWITPDKAAEITGLPATWFHEHTTDGSLPEGPVWKWHAGRKLINRAALAEHIARAPSTPSRRGRRVAAGARA